MTIIYNFFSAYSRAARTSVDKTSTLEPNGIAISACVEQRRRAGPKIKKIINT